MHTNMTKSPLPNAEYLSKEPNDVNDDRAMVYLANTKYKQN